jgi:hypothetical protein
MAMLQFHGSIGDGKYGVMNSQQIKDMLLAKYPYQATKRFESSMSTCINDVQSDKGTATGDYTHDGLTIYHASMDAGENKGCTLFYVKRPGNVAKVVGIGYHVGAQTYKVQWREGSWINTGGTVCLDK